MRTNDAFETIVISREWSNNMDHRDIVTYRQTLWNEHMMNYIIISWSGKTRCKVGWSEANRIPIGLSYEVNKKWR